MIVERKGNYMRKKIQSILSFVLALVIILAVIPVPEVVKAADPVKFELTTIDAANTGAAHLMMNANVDFTTHSVTAWTNVSSTVTYWAGTSASDATSREWGAVYAIGSQVFFENLLGALPTETYVKIAKDTQFAWGGKTFALAKDFVLEKEGGSWKIKEESPASESFELTTIDAANTGAAHLMMNANVDFTTHSVTAWTNVSSAVTYWAGTSASDATSREWGAVYAIGSQVFFENLLGALPTETYIKIAKDTQFVWAGKTFTLANDIEFEKVSGSWQIKVATSETTTFELTTIDEANTGAAHLMMNANVDFTTHSVAAWTNVSSAVTYLAGTNASDATSREWGAVYAIGSQVFFENLLGALSTETYIKIAKDTQFVWAGKTYTLAKDFILAKKDGTWMVSEEVEAPVEAVKFKMTSIVDGEVANGHFLINTNIGDFTTYGIENLTLCTGAAGIWAGTSKTNAAEVSWSAVYSFAEGRIFEENLVSGLGNGVTYVKFVKGSQFFWSNQEFVLEEDFVLKKIDGVWTVSEDVDEPPMLPTKLKITGVNTINVVRSGELAGLAEMTLRTDATWDAGILNINVDTPEQVIQIDASEQSLASVRPASKDGALALNHFGGNHMTRGTVITIPKGLQFTVGGVTYEVEKDYKFTYDGSTGVIPEDIDPEAPPTKVKITGINMINIVKGGELNGLAEMYLQTNRKWTTGNNISTPGQTIKVDETFQDLAAVRPTVSKKEIAFLHFGGGSMENGTVITIPKGLQFTIDGVVYEIEKNYVFTYDGNISGTPGLPPDITKYSYVNVNLSDIYVQGGNDLYLTTGIKNSHKYNNVVFLTSDLQVMCPNGTTDRIGSFRMHPDSGNLFIAFSYPVKEGVGIQIPKGAVAVNHEKKYGIRFVDDLGLYYTDGKWVLDNEAPVLTFQGERLKAGELYGLRLGMTEEEMKKLFAGEDSIQGKRNVKLFYPAEMFGADGKLKKGTYKMTISATDNSGNVTTYTIKVKGFTSDAPVIQIEGDSVREFDAGKKFDTSILKAKAKDANGKILPVTYSYSKGALDSKGQLKKGSHVLYLTTTDGTGHPYRKSVVLNCYDFTDIKVTGIYYFINDDIFLSTNLGENASLYEGTVLTADNLLMNNKPGFIKSMTIDLNSESLHILCKKKAGNVMTIAENSTFVNNTSYIGIRVKNDFQAHTDGTGWLMDRILGERGVGGYAGGFASPETGDSTSWYGYIVLCIFAAGVMCITYRKKEHSM